MFTRPQTQNTINPYVRGPDNGPSVLARKDLVKILFKIYTLFEKHNNTLFFITKNHKNTH